MNYDFLWASTITNVTKYGQKNIEIESQIKDF